MHTQTTSKNGNWYIKEWFSTGGWFFFFSYGGIFGNFWRFFDCDNLKGSYMSSTEGRLCILLNILLYTRKFSQRIIHPQIPLVLKLRNTKIKQIGRRKNWDIQDKKSTNRNFKIENKLAEIKNLVAELCFKLRKEIVNWKRDQ